MAASGDLTTRQYWDQTHKDLLYSREQLSEFPQFPWMPIVLEHLLPYRGQRFLELGCSPGQVSAMICNRIPLRCEGVDFSDTGWLYLRNLETVGVTEARLHTCDFREFHPPEPFDVVGSFGLVEHFDDPQEVLEHHDRLLRPGGLCVVELPRMRGLLWLHKWIFDRPNLRKHNVKMMRTAVFHEFARRSGQEILYLDMVGGPQVWGADPGGPEWLRRLRANTAMAVKRAVARHLKPRVREGHPWFAPWLLYIGRKK
jgi:cyclopropane fatty-acyl-phospholipid synthase-like methyltransferase